MKVNVYIGIGVFLFGLWGCSPDDRDDFEPVRPSIVISDPSQAATRGDLVTFDYRIFSGVDLSALTINNRSITPTTSLAESGLFTQDLIFEYTVPGDAPVGSIFVFTITLTDQLSRVVSKDLRLSIEKQARVLEDVMVDTRLDSTFNYFMEDTVIVSNNATLTIPAGTTIVAEASDEDQLLLIVEEGARIVADGTAENPIVFTTDDGLTGDGEPGTWAGIEINGDDGDPMDDSGILRYVRIEYAGTTRDDASLFLDDVGSGTIIDFVQAYGANERGIFVRGGTVNFRHIVGVNNQGASLFLRSGYQGNIQFFLVHNPDRDFDHGDRDLHMRSNGTQAIIANMTLVGNGDENQVGEDNELVFDLDGARLRDDDLNYRIYNSIVAEYPDDGLRIQTYTPGSDTLDYTYIFKIGSSDSGEGIEALGGSDALRDRGVVFFNSPNNRIDPDSTLIEGISVDSYMPSSTETVAFDPATINGFFVSAPYAGAFQSGNDWAIQWIRDGEGNVQVIRPEIVPELP